MAAAARENANRPLLKIKLGGEGDLMRLSAVRAAAPKARLIVDANEGWTPELLPRLLPEIAQLGVSLIEQPVPAGQDDVLARVAHPVPICAFKTLHTRP